MISPLVPINSSTNNFCNAPLEEDGRTLHTQATRHEYDVGVVGECHDYVTGRAPVT